MTRFWQTALRLGRVSNLPTVWTNVAAGIALNGGDPSPGRIVPLGLAMSAFYVGGMYLNDAFDHRWDAQHRPERPIPSGLVSTPVVYAAGFALLMLGLALAALSSGMAGFQAAFALGALVVIYDATHKWNPLGPVIMGLCRVAVYVCAALAVAPQVAIAVWVGAAALLVYLIALTMIARRETQNPRLPALVGMLIAGIALLDGAMLAFTGHPVAAAAAVGAFFLTRRLQRRIAGT